MEDWKEREMKHEMETTGVYGPVGVTWNCRMATRPGP